MLRDHLIACRSLTYAQRAARILERGGIFAAVTRLPPGLSDRGCAYALKVREDRVSRALTLLRAAGAAYGRIFAQDTAGQWEEVVR